MSPHRAVARAVARHWPFVLVAAVILVAFIGSGIAVLGRAGALDRALYEQCVRDETQDAVIVAQLRAAKRRALSTIPSSSSELYFQLQTLDDGINALEPPGERACQPPKGLGP